METQSQTPWYTDKALYLVILSFFLPALGKKLGLELDAEAIAGFIVTVVSFIVMHKYKSGKVLAAEIQADALKGAGLTEKAALASPEAAAAALAQAAK